MEEENETKVGNDKIFLDLKSDFDRGRTEKNRIRDIMVAEQKALAGEPQGNEKKGHSQIVLKEIAKAVNRTTPGLTEPFLSTAKPIKVSMAGSPLRKSLFENYLNMEFTDSMDREDIIETMVKVYLTSPTLWVQPEWIYEAEEEEIEYTDGSKATETIITENRPDIKVIQTQNVTIDPDATREEDSKFICVEEFSTYADLLKESGDAEDGLFDAGQMKKLKAWVDENQANSSTADEAEGVYDPRKIIEGKTASDGPRKRLEVVRYYGYYDMEDNGILKSIYAVWVKGKDCWLTIEERDFPLGRIPIYGTSFDKIPFSMNGNSLVSFLTDAQRVKTGIMRGILDNLDEANNGTIYYRPGDVTPESLMQMRLGHKYVAMNNPKGIEKGNFNQIPNSVFNVNNLYDKEIEELAGSHSASPSVSNSQLNKGDQMGMVSLAQEQQAASIRKLGGVLRKVMKHILIEAEGYLEDEQIQEYLPPNASPTLFSRTKKVKIGAQVGTKIDRLSESHNLNMLMQHSKENAKVMPADIHKQLLAKAFDLFGEYGMANQIRGKEERQDPMETMAMQLELQKLQLSNKKLMAEIEATRMKAIADGQKATNDANEISSKIRKNEADAEKKRADAQGKKVETAFVPAKELSGLEKEGQQQIGKDTNKQ